MKVFLSSNRHVTCEISSDKVKETLKNHTFDTLQLTQSNRYDGKLLFEGSMYDNNFQITPISKMGKPYRVIINGHISDTGNICSIYLKFNVNSTVLFGIIIIEIFLCTVACSMLVQSILARNFSYDFLVPFSFGVIYYLIQYFIFTNLANSSYNTLCKLIGCTPITSSAT